MNFIKIFLMHLWVNEDGFLGLGANPMTNQMKTAAATAGTTAAGYGVQAGAEGAQLNPFFTQEMKAQHSMTPGQENEMLTAANAGAGGAFGGAEGEMNRNAATTGNATTLTKSLDEMAREKAKVAADASEGIAAQDVAGVKALNQEGAAGMQGLYGANVGAQLKAMGQQGEDISEAGTLEGKGILQNIASISAGLGQGAGGAAALMKAMQ
jgi:hypothetical protein